MKVKFANIDANSFGLRDGNHPTLFNFGDHIQIAAINNLYEYMAVPKEQIVNISYYDIPVYDGEELILPFNLVYHFNAISPCITPVFLGIAILGNVLSSQMEDTLRNFGPVGCRDIHTYDLMCNYQIPAYLAGCITITFPKRKEQLKEYQCNYFIDTPLSLVPFIPKKLLQNAVVLNNEGYGIVLDYTENIPPYKFALNRLRALRDTARIVITSRLHIAAPCVAMGIPVIFATDTYKSTYSAVEKYIPMYTKEMYSEINWDPLQKSFEVEKHLLLQQAKDAVLHAYNGKKRQMQITQMNLRDRVMQPRKKGGFIESMLDTILPLWKDCENVEYGIWGTGEIAENVVKSIDEFAPQAHLAAVYDSYKTGTFFDIPIYSPRQLCEKENLFIIVAAFGAVDEAQKLFDEIGKRPSEFYLINHLPQFVKSVRMLGV